MRRAALAAAAVALSGCGDDPVVSSSTDEPAAPRAAASSKPRAPTVKIVRSEYGRVVADGRGEALYLFDKEKSKRSECYGACAKAWPPLLTKGKPRSHLLGTARRHDGKLQVTYAGHPLYYNEHDEPGRILCQN